MIDGVEDVRVCSALATIGFSSLFSFSVDRLSFRSTLSTAGPAPVAGTAKPAALPLPSAVGGAPVLSVLSRGRLSAPVLCDCL